MSDVEVIDPEPLVVENACEEWPVTWLCDVTDKTPEQLAAAQQAAIQMLWSYGGRHVGRCTYVESYWPPCASGCGGPWKSSDGHWHNGNLHDCCRILLAQQPPAEILSVNEWGTVLDPEAYALDGAYLRRRGACWSCVDDCTDPPVTVEYTAGFPLPGTTGLAVGEVACEILHAMEGGLCKLPSRAISITRQGVTVQLASVDDLTKQNRLGLPLADAWLQLVNPNALTTRSKVFSPDLARRGA